MTSTLELVLTDLLSKQSAKRRSAAKKLRKLADVEAGAPLLAALRAEVDDPRSWETQYQMIMALGESGYAESWRFIEELSNRVLDATMVYVAIGDALVRLAGDKGVMTLLGFIKQGRHPSLIDGALRAAAMLRIVPEDDEISAILEYAGALPKDDGNRFWILAACPGWPVEKIAGFLNDVGMSSRADFQEALQLARAGKYKTWRPL
jgi:hypothetical protein